MNYETNGVSTRPIYTKIRDLKYERPLPCCMGRNNNERSVFDVMLWNQIMNGQPMQLADPRLLSNERWKQT